jgi:hypothetical protein
VILAPQVEDPLDRLIGELVWPTLADRSAIQEADLRSGKRGWRSGF